MRLDAPCKAWYGGSMNELSFSPDALRAMQDAGWRYYSPSRWFERSYNNCDNADEIVDDLSDYTGYEVFNCELSCNEGYWYVFLRTDDECLDFAKKYSEYCNARQRIRTSRAIFNRTLVLTQEEHDKVKRMVEFYDKMIVGDHVLIAVPENATTKTIIAILDALGM